MKALESIQKFETPMLVFLQEQGVDFSAKGHSHYVMKHCEPRSEKNTTCIHGLMDLVVETWWQKDIMVISVCHYSEQEGDLMKDPEMVYHLSKGSLIEIPTEYYNDFMGVAQEVFPEIDGKKMVSPKLLKDLKEFTSEWVKNLRCQGHKMSERNVEN